MGELMNKVETLRWDDHRHYHQCRINQTLHLISAISFVVAYGLLFIDPAAAAMVGWLVGMVTRQSGHIFFEPRGYDQINVGSLRSFMALLGDDDVGLFVCSGGFTKDADSEVRTQEMVRVTLTGLERLFDPRHKAKRRPFGSAHIQF